MIIVPEIIEEAIWLPMYEGAGSAIEEKINGLQGTVVNPVWDTFGWLTLGSNTAVKLSGDIVDNLFRIDTLEGAIIVALHLQTVGTPTGQSQIFSYGDNGDTTNGAYSNILNSILTHNVGYANVGGSGYRQTQQNISSSLMNTPSHVYMSVLHRYDGYIYVDGYINGKHSKSQRVFDYEDGGEPTISQAGLTIGARGLNNGGSANYVGGVMTNPKMCDFMAFRVSGDQRHLIPFWMYDIGTSILRRQTPKLLRGVTYG